MSYDVTNCRMKEIENLRIPRVVLDATDAEADRDFEAGLCTYEFGEACRLTGRIDWDSFVVTEVDWYGECSGHLEEDVLKPLLAKSTGKLTLILIWEGGDAITRLSVVDGVASEEDVEL